MRTANNNTITAAQPRFKWWLWLVILVVLAIAGLLYARPGALRGTPQVATQGTTGIKATQAQSLDYQVVRSYPHDRNAFLQGLLWHNGGLYESTGLEGQSTLRRVEFPSGRVLQLQKLPSNIFGEGLALVDDRLIQITWRSQRAFVYDRATLRLINEWRYDGEGWGLTYNGQQLIMSDGSDVLTFRDPQTFGPIRKVQVTLNGRPLVRLNELEWIEGEVWANVWQTNSIVCIDPQSGQVTATIDLTGILPRNLRTGKEDVMNGIAYDPDDKRILVGGKFWPRLFEIRVEGRTQRN